VFTDAELGAIREGIGEGDYPVCYPVIDFVEICDDGGTITRVDEGGALLVGPLSAGTDPGHTCYEKGGEDPTVTDANLVLGILEPSGANRWRWQWFFPKLAKGLQKNKVASVIGCYSY